MKKKSGFNLLITSILIFITVIYILIFFASFSIIEIKGVISALVKPDVRFAIKLSVLTAMVVTFLSLMFGVPSAYALSRMKIPFKWVIEAILDVPIALSPVAIGAMFLIFFNTGIGQWFEENVFRFVFEVPGIILVQTAIVLPFAIRVMKSHFDTIPESYELVARSLGYSRAEAFIYVAVPLSKNAILATLLTSFAKALGEFGATVTVAGAISMKTQTLPVSIYMSLASADIQKTFVLIFILVFIAIINMLLIKLIVNKGAIL